MPQLLEEIYDKAWGKSWPTTTFTILRSEIFPNETNSSDGDERMEIDDDDNGFNFIPEESTFTCLREVNLLQDALEIPGRKLSVIVIRNEYEFLRNLFEEQSRHLVVTGQPGIGKTMFLLYLLLHRLERQLPTAVQFERDSYIVFKSDGVYVSPTDKSKDHRRMLPRGCWCLSDGNAYVAQPCQPFSRTDLRTFLITSPSPDGYKKWVTQEVAKTVITDLPLAGEVAAIALMNGHKPCDAVSIMWRWGPNTRTVLSILEDQDEETALRRYAEWAAVDIYNDPSMRHPEQLPSGQGFTLLFIRPTRSNDNFYYGASRAIIPTMHLSEIFDSQCQGLSAQSIMRLHDVFSMRPATRGHACWLHKKSMHLQMTAVTRHEIFNGSAKFYMYSTASVVVGTASALRAAACSRLSSFYWFPSLVIFPGIDGILVCGNHIYALQATISDTHDRPHDGLKKAWQTIGTEVALHFTWHFVIVTDNKPLADKYAKAFGTELEDVTLGRHPYVGVSVWVYVLKGGVWPLGDDGTGVGNLNTGHFAAGRTGRKV